MAFSEEHEDMEASLTAPAELSPCVPVVLTPTQAQDVARTIRGELAFGCERTLAAPMLGREDIARLLAVIDRYAERLELLEWGQPRADIEVVCPQYLFEPIAEDLRIAGEEGIEHNEVALCAVVEHLLEYVI
jgi:hypothetical protein